MTLAHFLMESAMKRTIHRKSFKGLLKETKTYYATNSVGKNLYTNGVWALLFSLLHIARGLDWHSQRNIIETFLVKVTCVGDIDCFPNYEIGYAVEVLSSSFSSLFYISSQMLDKGYVYPQKFLGVQHRPAT